MQKALRFLAAFFATLANLLCSIKFLHTLFLKNEEKISETKNRFKCFPIDLYLTYPKLGKSEQKVRTAQNST